MYIYMYIYGTFCRKMRMRHYHFLLTSQAVIEQTKTNPENKCITRRKFRVKCNTNSGSVKKIIFFFGRGGRYVFPKQKEMLFCQVTIVMPEHGQLILINGPRNKEDSRIQGFEENCLPQLTLHGGYVFIHRPALLLLSIPSINDIPFFLKRGGELT